MIIRWLKVRVQPVPMEVGEKNGGKSFFQILLIHFLDETITSIVELIKRRTETAINILNQSECFKVPIF
jgi:hypothetical protein